MFLYRSTFTLVVSPTGRQSIQPTVASAITAGGWVAKDLRDNTDAAHVATAGNCLVGTPVAVVSPPAGVTFLLNTATDMNTVVPSAIVTALNNALAVTIPQGVLWKELLRRLLRVLGSGRWGLLDADFGHVGALSV